MKFFDFEWLDFGVFLVCAAISIFILSGAVLLVVAAVRG